MSWNFYFLVGLGGAIGSMFRAGVNRLIPFNVHSFSWSTFSVNMLGSILIGVLWVKLHSDLEKAFWVSGFLGGLTTFSGLGLEVFRYLNEKNYLIAVVYVLSSLLIGIFLVWLGQKLASLY